MAVCWLSARTCRGWASAQRLRPWLATRHSSLFFVFSPLVTVFVSNGCTQPKFRTSGPYPSQKICGNEAFTSRVVGDAIISMSTTLVREDSFSSRLDLSFSRGSKLHMLSFQLLIDRFQLRARLGRNSLEENEWLFPFPSPLNEGRPWPEFGPNYWLPYNSETTVVPATWFHLVVPELDEWRRWQWLSEFRLARWREIVAVVRRGVRLWTQALQLLLRTLCRPLFACHLSRKEHVWMLLHGAHPARGDAGISQPAFAQLWEGTLRIRPANP